MRKLVQLTTEGYRDKLIWSARYKDGSIFPQYENGEEHSYEHIDKSRLESFALHDLNGNKYLEQRFKPGQLFMYRRRTALKTGHNVIERIHIIVCQENDKRHVAFVFESDLHIEIGDFSETQDDTATKWSYPFQAVPADAIPIG